MTDIYNIFQLSIFLFYIILAVFIFQRGKGEEKYSLIIFCLSLAVLSIGQANLYSLSHTTNTITPIVLFWSGVCTIGLVLILPALFHFFVLLISYKPLIEHSLYYVVYAISIGLMIPLIFNHYYVDFFTLKHYTILTPVVNLYYIFSFLLFSGIVYILYIDTKKIEGKIGHKMTKYFTLGGIYLGIVVILHMLVREIRPYSNILMFPYTMFLCYIILRYQLIPFTYIKKVEAHSIASGLLMALLVSGILYIDYFFRYVTGIKSYFPTVIFSLGIVGIFTPLNNQINRFIDKVLFVRSYRQSVALQEFTRKLSGTLTKDVLLKLMMDTLTKLVDTNIIFIMVPDDKGYYRITQAKRVSENNIKFSNNHPVIRTLKTKKTPLVRNNIEDTELLRYFEQGNVNIFVPVIYKDELLSIIGIGDKQYGEYHDDDLLRLYSFSVNAALGMINTNLYEERTKHLYKGIKVLAKALEIKDTYTYGHCERVAEIAVKIGVELGLSDSQLEDIRISAILHDIGKIGVSRQILNKPRFLSPQEFQEIKKHPEIGIRIVESIPFSRDVLHGVKLHHERFDGNGYPEGREKTESPLIARIIQVADAYEAMTSDRPYRKAMKKEDALREIKIGKGTQFDPEIVDVFLKIIENEEL